MRTLSLALLTACMIGLRAGLAMADLPAPDQQFALRIAASSMAEIQLGQLAQLKASSSDIKQLGRRVVADHTAASQDLQQIADAAGLALPDQPERSAQAMYQRLRGTTDSDFDQALVQQILRDHRQDLAAFRQEAQSGQDPDLKAFAKKYLPMIQQHLQLAQSLSRPG